MKFFESIIETLKQDKQQRFFSDTGELLRNAVYEAIMQMDKDLIKSLLDNTLAKERFFKDIDGVLVFDKVAFGWVINNKEFLPDSYTRYKNSIGLVDSKEQFISAKNDVVIAFPYKDCVLEGGQTKEDQKRGEIFYNETLAPDDVDRLLSPKVLCNAKRYTKNGEESITSFDKDDNLLIKGNNLLVISSLLKRYEGKIKLIYIDPPYNTGNDGFNYNDNFNHSTWLVFMKNRLEVAKRLLSSDGSIMVQLDFNEVHYAKVLMDEVFGMENFKNDIIWCYTGPAGATNFLPRKHDDILFYGKTPLTKFNMPYVAHKSGVHNTGQVFGSTETNGTFKEEVEARGKKLEDWWIDIYSTDRYRREHLGFSGQKPEKLIKRIIDMTTDKGDVVMDYHLGSGTTGAVAHKMGRRWIGIEQLDYGDNDSVVRLQNVLNGDQNGVSKEPDVNWNGGGSFVYCELKENNQTFVDKIMLAKTDKTLSELFTQIVDTGFISYKVKVKDVKASVGEFQALAIEDKKRFLSELLDKNMLYANYCDIDDVDYAISEEDKTFSKSFYEVDR